MTSSGDPDLIEKPPVATRSPRQLERLEMVRPPHLRQRRRAPTASAARKRAHPDDLPLPTSASSPS